VSRAIEKLEREDKSDIVRPEGLIAGLIGTPYFY